MNYEVTPHVDVLLSIKFEVIFIMISYVLQHYFDKPMIYEVYFH